MKSLRIAAAADIILIMAVFAAMIITLFGSRFQLFFILGGVLAALLAVGFLIRHLYKKQTAEEENGREAETKNQK